MTRKRSSNGSTTVSTKKDNSISPNKVSMHVQKLYCLFCYKLTTNDKDSLKELRIDKANEKNRQSDIFMRFCSQVSSNKKGINGEDEKFQLLARKCGVCDDCFSVIENYCSIFQEIEYLNLRLRWRLDKIQMVMKYAGKVPSRVKAFKESFKNDAGIQQDLMEVTQIRQELFDACSKRLKARNPVVVLSPINIINDASHHSLGQTLENATICGEEEGDACTPQTTESNNLDGRSIEIVTHSNEDNEDSNEIMYVIKAEGPNGGSFVTPPESVLNALQSGDLPTEGVTKHHYFYCTTVTESEATNEGNSNSKQSTSTETSKNAILSPPSDVPEESANNAMYSDLDDLIGSPNEGLENLDSQSASEKESEVMEKDPAPIYKCIKCAETFPTEELIIRHARVGNCFTDENIDLTLSPPRPPVNQKKDASSASQKRKRPSSVNTTEPKAKRLKKIPSAVEKRKDRNAPTSGGNVITNVLDKILSGLQSTSICPNCSESFPNEKQFRSHLFTRECFRDIKKRSCSTAAGQKKTNEDDDESESDNDLSSLSESSHEEDSDSDYAPILSVPRATTNKSKRSKNNGSGKRPKGKEVSKTSCPVDNCDKFFLYKEDLEHHLKEKHEVFSCQWCSFTTDQAISIATHEIHKHSKDLNGYAICPRCPATITLSSDKAKQTEHYINRHLSSKAKAINNEKGTHVKLECDKCGKVFKAKEKHLVEFSLNRHIKNVHKKNKR